MGQVNLLEDMASEATLQLILTEIGQKLEAGQAVALSTTNFPDSATTAKVEELRALIAGLLVASRMQTDTNLSNPREKAWMTILSRMTHSLSGLRVDASGAAITANIAAAQTLATLTLLAQANQVAMGNLSTSGQSAQLLQSNFQVGFRRNLVVS